MHYDGKCVSFEQGHYYRFVRSPNNMIEIWDHGTTYPTDSFPRVERAIRLLETQVISWHWLGARNAVDSLWEINCNEVLTGQELIWRFYYDMHKVAV